MPQDVYDREQEKQKSGLPPEDSPDFLRQREGLDNPDTKDNQPVGDPDDPRELKDQEDSTPATQHEQQVGHGYTGEKDKIKLKGRFSRRQKLIGLGTGLIGGSIIGFILFFLPALRLEGYLSSINRRVFATAESAVANRMEHLLERYMITHVLNLERCNKIRTIDCRADYSRMGPAGGLFNAWRDAKIEQKLIDKFGLTFETFETPDPGKPRIIIKSSKTGKTITLTEGHIAKGQFFGGDREFGREVNRFLRENTHWAAVLQRRSVRKYFVRKHDTKFWCFFACTTKDNIDRKILDAKTRLKYRLVERTIYPFSTKLGLIMDCVINPGGEKCSAKGLRERGIDRTALSDEDMDDLLNRFKENPNLRFSRLITEKLLEKIIGATAARTTVGAIPVAGQVYLALLLLDTFNEMDRCIHRDCLSKFAADLNSRQYLEYYKEMRTLGDELKAGALSAKEVGVLMDEFQGDHPAEQSLIYQAYNNPDKSIASLVDSRAYAASTEPNKKEPYVCADGKPIPSGELVCPEKKVARKFKVEEIRNNTIVNGLAEMFNSYDRCYGFSAPVIGCNPPAGVNPRNIIHPTLGAINNFISFIAGPIFNGIFFLLEHAPGIGSFLELMKNTLGVFTQLLFEKIFPLPVQIDSPGREKYDGLEAGGEVAASEFGKGGYTQDDRAYGLGGKKLNTEERAAILQDYLAQEEYNYQHSSFLAKLTNLNYPASLINRFIAATPSSFNRLSQRFMAILSKPFNGLFNFGHKAYAGGTLLAESPFGIPRFGYVLDDPAFTIDPAELTEDFCEAAKQKWQDSMKEDELTGIDEYYVTNPCLLEQVVVEAGASALTGNDSLEDGIDGVTP